MKKRSGLWFWLFWLLILAIIGGALTTAYLALKPSNPTITTTRFNPDTSFDLTLNRDQINGLAGSYLKDQGNGNLNFVVEPKDVKVTGQVKVLGQNLNSQMILDPETNSDGNIVLKAKSITLGQIDLPVKVAMGYIKAMYDGPSYVIFQPDQEQILIDMSKVGNKQGLSFKSTGIDMDKNQYKFVGEVTDAKK
ncbi:YpmS family protein [Leuconostocaceae bacterium ESL0723]|nr:YpmS family protein [Lactobacillaceae bacterium L1_55_11]WEV55121.1 YpmS family protein [Leuconostocaceae bacterium ESL0723]